MVLAYWFAQNNVDDTIIFIQYLLLFLFRFVQLLTRINEHRVIFTVDGLITMASTVAH